MLSIKFFIFYELFFLYLINILIVYIGLFNFIEQRSYNQEERNIYGAFFSLLYKGEAVCNLYYSTAVEECFDMYYNLHSDLPPERRVYNTVNSVMTLAQKSKLVPTDFLFCHIELCMHVCLKRSFALGQGKFIQDSFHTRLDRVSLSNPSLYLLPVSEMIIPSTQNQVVKDLFSSQFL